jgi:hypothetical protein
MTKATVHLTTLLMKLPNYKFHLLYQHRNWYHRHHRLIMDSDYHHESKRPQTVLDMTELDKVDT